VGHIKKFGDECFACDISVVFYDGIREVLSVRKGFRNGCDTYYMPGLINCHIPYLLVFLLWVLFVEKQGDEIP
jgi:hypothetical protein